MFDLCAMSVGHRCDYPSDGGSGRGSGACVRAYLDATEGYHLALYDLVSERGSVTVHF